MTQTDPDEIDRKNVLDTSAAERVAQESNPFKRWLKVLGPGLVTGASDDDPSGIATYAVAGAAFGFATLWTALITLPLMASTQFISAKIGMVGGTGLAGAIRQHYPKALLYPIILMLAVANMINAGTDIGAVGAAFNLFIPLPAEVFVIPVAIVILLIQVFGSYRLLSKIFRWLTLALLAYIATAFFARPDLRDVLAGTFVPTIRLDARFISTLVALLGTTISPYLWFWQSSQEVDEEREQGRATLVERQGASKLELKYKGWDVMTGMLLSNIVMYFIILTTAATLHSTGHTDINSATDAAQALRPLAGDLAKYLLAAGLIGAGLLAIPVLTGSAGYAVAEAFGWHSSLDAKPARARELYGVITVATIVGISINFLGINPIDALFYTAVINGLVAPPVLLVVMLLCRKPEVLGNRMNSPGLNLMGWLTTTVMTVAAIALLALWVAGAG